MGPRDLATCSGNVQLVQTLRAFGVRFLVVGGMALHHYDSTRQPGDMDLAFEPIRENVEKLVEALKSLGVTFPPDAVDQLLAKKDGFPLKGPTSPFCADILRARDFTNEWVSASQASIGGVPVRVVSARAMLEGLACDTPKHVEDIARLRQVLAARP